MVVPSDEQESSRLKSSIDEKQAEVYELVQQLCMYYVTRC